MSPDMLDAVLRALLLDFNGVLVDDEPIHCELFRQVLAEEGVEITDEDYTENYLGVDDRHGLAHALETAGRADVAALLPRLVARKAAYYQARIRSGGYPFFAGARELVEAAAQEETMLGVVSGALRAEVEGALAQLGSRERFKVVVTAEDVERSKPAPDGYLRALALLNSRPPLPQRLLHPHEVLAIEDSPPGIEAASAAGMPVLGVAHTHPEAALASADHVVPALAGVDLASIRRLFADFA